MVHPVFASCLLMLLYGLQWDLDAGVLILVFLFLLGADSL